MKICVALDRYDGSPLYHNSQLLNLTMETTPANNPRPTRDQTADREYRDLPLKLYGYWKVYNSVSNPASCGSI